MPGARRAPPLPNHPPIEVRERLLDRLAASAELEAALELLQHQLAIATERLEKMGDGGRYGVALAMHGLSEYFTSLGLPGAVLEPIHAVTAAIVDARRGVESPIFKPDRQSAGGAPPTSVTRLTFDGHVAVVVECCVMHCRDQGFRPYVDPACKLAANLIRKSRWNIELIASELRELRERVRASPPHSPDNYVYRNLMDSEVARARPLQYATTLAAHPWVNQPPA